MWHIIVRTHSGEYIRETSDNKPENRDIRFWEDFHSCRVSAGKDYGIYESYTNRNAVVVNIYETED